MLLQEGGVFLKQVLDMGGGRFMRANMDADFGQGGCSALLFRGLLRRNSLFNLTGFAEDYQGHGPAGFPVFQLVQAHP